MLLYFTIPATGTGTAADPIRPALPDAVGWAGHYDVASGTYLVATRATLSGVQGVTAVAEAGLPTACAARGLQVADVLRWYC